MHGLSSLGTHFDAAWFLTANSARPMVSTIASCTPMIAKIRCFKDSLAHGDVGNLGNGFSNGLASSCDVIKSSFSA
jgi:hypothetical protein